jgi:large subunit ribosomal protein L28
MDRTEPMARRCQITGAGTRSGNRKATRGKAKYLGGVGTKITGLTKRRFKVNLQKKRIWVPELEQFVRVRLSVRALKTISKNGAYRTLLDAGLLPPHK